MTTEATHAAKARAVVAATMLPVRTSGGLWAVDYAKHEAALDRLVALERAWAMREEHRITHSIFECTVPGSGQNDRGCTRAQGLIATYDACVAAVEEG